MESISAAPSEVQAKNSYFIAGRSAPFHRPENSGRLSWRPIARNTALHERVSHRPAELQHTAESKEARNVSQVTLPDQPLAVTSTGSHTLARILIDLTRKRKYGEGTFLIYAPARSKLRGAIHMADARALWRMAARRWGPGVWSSVDVANTATYARAYVAVPGMHVITSLSLGEVQARRLCLGACNTDTPTSFTRSQQPT